MLGSTFADWWAYKYEVNDAIPYNAAIMMNEGVKVSINSDDAEMSRRLNQEAAKTVKYGNVTEEEAWNFVTLNPAKFFKWITKWEVLKWVKMPMLYFGQIVLYQFTQEQKKNVSRRNHFLRFRKRNGNFSIDSKERAELINLMLDAKNKGMKTQLPKKKKTVTTTVIL